MLTTTAVLLAHSASQMAVTRSYGLNLGGKRNLVIAYDWAADMLDI